MWGRNEHSTPEPQMNYVNGSDSILELRPGCCAVDESVLDELVDASTVNAWRRSAGELVAEFGGVMRERSPFSNP